MTKGFKFFLLVFLLIAGAVVIVYSFAREDFQNLKDTLVGKRTEIPVEEEPTPGDLLSSLLSSTVDFDTQMAKLRTGEFENEYFIARVNKVTASEESLVLEMEFPMGDSSEVRELVTTASCPVENTTILGPQNMEILAEKTDIFQWVKKDNLLIAYCLDSACSSVGKECILITTGVE